MPVGTVAARERLAFNPADWTLPSPGSPCESLQPSCDAAIACQPACAAKGRAVPLGFQAAPASLGAAIGESSSPAVSAASTASAEVEARSPAARRRRPFRSDSWEPEVAFPEQSEQQEEHQVFNGPQDRYAGTALSPSCSTAAADSAPFAAAAADSFATPPAGLLPSPGCTAWSGRSAGSDAATPASRLSASPHQQQVEILEARLAAERDARAALTRRLAEQRAEAEQQCQALGQRYEQQLAELRDELQQGAAAAAATAASGGNLAGSLEDADALRRLAEQDMLLRAYQAENELAATRLRQMAVDRKTAAAEAAAREEELQAALAQALAQAERARATPPGTPGVDAARLTELLRLQGELEAVRTAAAQRERELRTQAERAEQGRCEAMQQLEAAAADRAELARTQQQLADSDGLVRQQAALINQLEQQLLAQDALPPAPLAAAQQARLQHLEAENASLRAGLAHAQAVGLGGGGGGDGDSSDHQRSAELQSKLARLQSALQLKEGQHERQLRALKREHERLRVEQGIRAASRASAARVKELEAQLAQEREAAGRRVRLLEVRLKEAESRAAPVQQASSSGGGGGSARSEPAAADTRPVPRPGKAGKAAAAQHEALLAATTQLRQRDARVRRLESEAARRDAELEILQQRAAAADEHANSAAEREAEALRQAAAAAQAVEEVAAANESLQAQVRQVAALRTQVAAAEAAAVELQQQGEQLREAQTALAAQQRGQEEREAAAAAALQRQQEQHSAALEAAQRAGDEAMAAQWGARLAAAEAAAAEARAAVARLQGELRSARAGLPWLPSAAEFAALEKRMEEVEAAAAAREARWAAAAEAAAGAAAAHHQRLRAQFEAALAAKEGEVEGFRQQLEGVLAAARALQAAQGCGRSGGS